MYASYKELLKSDDYCNIDGCVFIKYRRWPILVSCEAATKPEGSIGEVPFPGEKFFPPCWPTKYIDFYPKREK